MNYPVGWLERINGWPSKGNEVSVQKSSYLYSSKLGQCVLDEKTNSCNCDKWQVYTLPYSHVVVVCIENGKRADSLLPKIYL